MSVVTRNPFALLNDDDEAPVAPVVVAPVAPAVEAPRTNTRNRGGNNATSSSRGGKYYKRGGGAPASAPTPDADGFIAGNPNETGVRFQRTEGRPERGRGRGGRGGRGRDGDRSDRGRVYDKHSQTGVTDTEKQVSQGWGADTGAAELKAEIAGEADAAAETTEATTAGDWGAPAAAEGDWAAPAADAAAPTEGATADATAAAKNGAERKPRREQEEEEEDNTVSYEEYLAQKKTSDAVPKLEGGRTVDAEWKDAVPLTKDEADDVYFAGKTKAPPKARTKKEEKVIIEIDARFERPQRDGAGRGRGGRGGRGGDRGGRGGDRSARGGPRGGARGVNGSSGRAVQAVDVDDQRAFPSLGA